MSSATSAALRRLARRHRRAAAAVCLGLAVFLGLRAARPAEPPARRVLAAAHDIASGARLTAADVVAVALPPAAVPDGALLPGAAVVGDAAAGALRRGEPLTDARVLGAGLLTGAPAGDVASAVRVADPGAALLVRPGDRVDVLATPPDGGGDATAVARDVVVLAVPRSDDDLTGTGGDGALIIVASDPATAAALARAAVGDRISMTLRGGRR